MDAAYSWHPGISRVVSKWAVPVPLLPDELLSSWLVRAALTQGCDPLVFTGELWPKWRIWTRDPDRGLSQERFSVLAEASGIKVSAFKAACLPAVISATVTEFFEDFAIWPWVLAFGSRNRKRHGGLQYCPLCLKGDKKPYYRMQWRLAWHTSCPRHGACLFDRCPNCAATIEPHRLSAFDGDIAICATCKHDLRDTVTLRINSDALAFQQAADRAVRQGGKERYGINKLSSHQWFALSRYFVRLLRKVALGKSEGLVAFAKTLGVDTAAIASPATGLALELLPVQERALLLAGAWRILEAGPEQLLVAAKAASINASILRERHQAVSSCVEGIIQALPEKSVSRRRREQQGILKPRSRLAVMRMFARLHRKVQLVAR